MKVEETYIEEEMRESYINYAMSVIRGRAIPDVRDGLKPVQRRILYGMYKLGLTPDKPTRKSARIVGDCMGKYHPHGDQAIYDAMVNMAQDFSFRYPLIEGQGNWGSIDGDSAAAMRYTEARLSKISWLFLEEIEEGTVNFIPNFDNSLEEPEVLPAKVPNILLNGSWGISVGMTTQIPPHNLGEVIEAIVYLIDNPKASLKELMKFIKGPDFPTGGIIFKEGIEEVYRTGSGGIKVRATTTIEDHMIVITEIPYQVRKSTLIESIAHKVQEGVLPILDLRDESDREGLRIVIELKKGVNPKAVLNKLYKHTPLEWTVRMNFLVIKDGNPRKLSLKEILECFISFRREILRRRTQYRLNTAQKRAHILKGLKEALQNRSEVIEIISKSGDSKKAGALLKQRYSLSDAQVEAILGMRLRQLTTLEREKIETEYEEKIDKIKEYQDILKSQRSLDGIIKEELLQLKVFSGRRRTQIEDMPQEAEQISDYDYDYDVVISITERGYVNAPRKEAYKKQNRGGKGLMSIRLREDDKLQAIFTANARDQLIVFTDAHKAYKLRAFQLPSSRRDAKGVNLRELIELGPQEKVLSLISLKPHQKYCLLATAGGIINKKLLKNYYNAHSKGIIALAAGEGDKLVDVAVSSSDTDILLATAKGQVIRFSSSKVRCTGRTSGGVKGIRLNKGDRVVGMATLMDENSMILLVTENGYGKRTPAGEFPRRGRGGVGVLGIKVDKKTKAVVGLKEVKDDDEILVTTKLGKVIRIGASKIRVVGRYAKGVKLIDLDGGDEVASVIKVS